MALVIGTEFNDVIAPNSLTPDVEVDGVVVELGVPLPPGSDLLGDDVIDPGLGSDTISGGAGIDTLDYTESATGSLNVNFTAPSSGTVIGTDNVTSLTNVNSSFTNIEGFVGGAFDDVINGSSGADILAGGEGNDIIAGLGGDDILYGDDKDGLILPDEFLNIVDYSANTADVTVNLELGTAISTGSGNDTLTNFNGVYGGAGNDILIGNEFDNLFRGGAGNDTITGGDGIDTVDYSTATAGVVVDLNNTTASDGQGGTDTFASSTPGIPDIEGVIGSAFNDTLTGNILDNVLIGGVGNDILNGLDGADTLNGGAGNDTVSGGNGSDTIQVGAEGVAFGDVLDGGADADTLVNIGIGNLAIANWSAANNIETINAGATPGLGIVGYTDGVNADNNLDLSATTLLNVAFVDGGAGNDTIVGGAGDINIFGGLGNDTLTGGGGKSNIEGNDGDDIITGGASDNVLDGGAGNDTITGAGGGKNTLIGGIGNDTLIAVGAGDNTLDGGAGNDVITGGDGKDVIILGAGVDTANAGAGDDTIQVGDEGLVAGEVLNGGAGVDTLENIGTGHLVINAWNGLNGIEFIDASVNGLAQSIAGDATANVLDFSATELVGVTSIEGLGGNDVITTSTDDIIVDGGAGDDTLTAVGAGKVTLIGGIGTDALNAGDGESTLDGGAGNDTLNGGSNKDTIILGAGVDTVSAGASDDTIVVGDEGLVAGEVLNGGDGLDTLKNGGTGALKLKAWNATNSIEKINAFDGLGVAQAIVGLDGATAAASINILNFSATQLEGVDYIDGGLGNDIITGATLGQNDIRGGLGNDTLIGGSEGNILDGGAGNDILTGGAKEDTLLGGAGADNLVGGDEKDSLTGGAGNDILNGGTGNDTFIFASGFGLDRIVGFEDGLDRIDLTAFATTFGALNIVQSGADTLVRSASVFGPITTNRILLQGVSAATIDASDFLF